MEVFEEIMAENFPELAKDTKHIFKKHYEPHRTSTKKTTSKLTRVNLLPHFLKRERKRKS